MIDPSVSMAHHQRNEFLPSAHHGPRAQPAAVEAAEADDFDVQFDAIRNNQKEQMMDLNQHYQDRRDILQKQIQAEQEGLFNAFQQGMQALYGTLVQQVAATIDVQVRLRVKQEKLQDEHAARKADIERRYHQETSMLFHAARRPKHLQTMPTDGAHTASFPVSFLGPPDSCL